MRMSEIGYEGPRPIDSYGSGGFRIGGAFHEGSLILTETGAAPWAPGDLGPEAFAALIAIADQIDVLLVGMGGEIAALPSAARAALEAAGVGVEVMNTASACRTYNVLLAEERRIAAALIAV